MTTELDLTALLQGWDAPPPKGEGADDAWDARAEAIVQAALAQAALGPRAEGAGAVAAAAPLESLLDPPELDPEPGEADLAAPSGDGPFDARALFVAASGDNRTMSQDADDAAGAAKSEPNPPSAGPPPSLTPTPPPTERKRTSLKAMAEKASQAGARVSLPGSASSRGSNPDGPTSSRATPVPSGRISTTSTPLPVSTSTPLPKSSSLSAKAGRPVEAKSDDSGIVDLAGVRAAATAEQVAAAEKAKPATEGLFDDEEKKAKDSGEKRAVARAVPARAVAPAPAKKGNGPVIGLTIAALGIAAAFALMQTRKPPPGAPSISVSDRRLPQPIEPVKATPPPVAATALAEAPPSSTGDAPAAAPLTSAAASGAPVAVAAATPPAPASPGRAAVAGPSGPTSPGSTEPKPAAAAATAAASAKPTDLASAMAQAVGPEEGAAKGAAPASSEPASGGRNQNIPEQPSQGAAQAAIASVMGGAKACVAGGTEVTHANVTFGSSGAVTSVSVSGWAATNGKSACVQAALKGAKVGPFSRPTYVVGVPVRP